MNLNEWLKTHVFNPEGRFLNFIYNGTILSSFALCEQRFWMVLFTQHAVVDFTDVGDNDDCGIIAGGRISCFTSMVSFGAGAIDDVWFSFDFGFDVFETNAASVWFEIGFTAMKFWCIKITPKIMLKTARILYKQAHLHFIDRSLV